MNVTPIEIEQDLKKARRLVWWTIFWQLTILVVMFFTMGSSQAMKSAWTEDLLGLVPAVVFLTALHFEQKPPTDKFPFGFSRVNSLGFLVAAVALLSMGLYLIYDAGMHLIRAEHPTIGAAPLFGPDLWLGWLMVAALAYSVIPPIILGHLKQPVAKRLQDKVLHTDALMQKADWMTGVAGAFGIIGVGFGWWWADSVAALIIAIDIVRDGKKAVIIATAELIDGAPRQLESNKIASEAKQLREHLEKKFFAKNVRMRESGRFIMVQVDHLEGNPDRVELWPADSERKWRLAEISQTEDIRPKLQR